MKITYVFEIDEDIYNIDGLHMLLDIAVNNCLASSNIYASVIKSTLENENEISVNDYLEGR